MGAILAVIGFIILVSGHQLQWVFVGGGAFVLGGFLSVHFRFAHSQLDQILAGSVSSVIGLLVSTFIKKFLLILASALASAYALAILPGALNWSTAWISWLVLLLAAAAGALAVLTWGSLPLILVTVLFGSALILSNVRFGTIGQLPMFIVLVIFGLTAQWVLWRYSTGEQT
ncbi:MAG: hypothetical protein L0Z70_00150 [Chloroflexi bacterium]|nr:hypothetical protein [Chloroflexota bacterium]